MRSLVSVNKLLGPMKPNTSTLYYKTLRFLEYRQFRELSTSSSSLKYYLLRYEYSGPSSNLMERRAPHRPLHLELCQEYVKKGKLLLGGAFADPIDGAAIVFSGTEDDVKEFVRRDPYVQKGIVTKHSFREWTVVVGADYKGPAP